MPYKVTGIKGVNDAYKKLIKKIADKDSAKTLVKIAVTGSGFAKLLTPREYGLLINSQYISPVKSTSSGLSIKIGYTQNYAAPLHNRKDWKPRPVDMKKGPSANLRAEPMFLTKGFTGKNLEKIRKIIINGYKIK